MGRKNDRLQERLAKAVVNRNSVKSTTSSAFPSGASSPIKAPDSSRSSLDRKSEEIVPVTTVDAQISNESGTDIPDLESGSASSNQGDAQVNHPPKIVVGERHENVYLLLPEQKGPLVTSELSSIPSQPSEALTEGIVEASPPISADQLLPAHGDTIRQLQSELGIVELRHQEEIHEYMERNDALQVKLQYLSSQAAAAARKNAEDANLGSLDRIIAQKDEKIALLFEEGQKLSQNEMKQLTSIKKLRAKLVEEERKTAQTTRKLHEMEEKTRILEERARRSESLQTQYQTKMKDHERTVQELDRITMANFSMSSIIAGLEQQIAHVKSVGALDEVNKYKELLEVEKGRVTALEDDLTTAKFERDLSDDRYRSQLRDFQAIADRDKERARATEIDLRGELSVC